MCGALLTPAVVRADAFSPIPDGSPIYRQLDSITLSGEGKTSKQAANLTRYEAALQVGRVAVVVGNKPDSLSRSGWRALRELAVSLKVELQQLGVNVDDLLSQCVKQIDAPTKTLLPPPAPPRVMKPKGGKAPSMPSLLGSAPSPAQLNLGQNTNAFKGEIRLPILGRARLEAASMALQRDAEDPLFTRSGALGARNSASRFAGRGVAVGVDVNSWLNVRAYTSQQKLGMGIDRPLALSSPLFAGANEATGFGGGVEVSPLNGLKFSTNIERLSTDTGASGTRLGGGVGLSAWQNRLTLSAHMARLQPEDRALLAMTETELRLGVGVTRRLSLSLLYQGLASSQSESSRMAGGFNFSF